MTLDRAISEIGNAVYAACGMYEELEFAGSVVGNGHHMRQYAAEAAMKILFKQWKDEEEKKVFAENNPSYRELLR